MSYAIDYRDRRGLPLSFADWSRLFDNPHYAVLRRRRVGDWDLELCWVGACGSFEERPKLFLMTCGPAAKDKAGVALWLATEQEGLAAWEQAVEAAGAA
jgi:hypothetical protein